MIIFSQQPTQHSRLGNSLVWMSRMHYLMTKAKINFFFPWGHENFKKYFDLNSAWIKYSEEAEFIFQERFNKNVTAENLNYESRKIEHNYEIFNSLSPFNWEKIVIPDASKKILYLAGKIDITDHGIINLIKEHKFTICHEPYNYVYRLNNEYIGEDFNSIAPDKMIYQNQKSIVKKISQGKTNIGLHIRRGDYTTISHVLPVIDKTYIDESLKQNGSYTTLFIFSDDVEWIKQNLSYPNQIIVTGLEDYEELWLMSLCKNNIMSNSTFSWWGVFLNKNVNKKVYTPSIWFGPSGEYNWEDIYIESWTKINVKYSNGLLIH